MQGLYTAVLIYYLFWIIQHFGSKFPPKWPTLPSILVCCIMGQSASREGEAKNVKEIERKEEWYHYTIYYCVSYSSSMMTMTCRYALCVLLLLRHDMYTGIHHEAFWRLPSTTGGTVCPIIVLKQRTYICTYTDYCNTSAVHITAKIKSRGMQIKCWILKKRCETSRLVLLDANTNYLCTGWFTKETDNFVPG